MSRLLGQVDALARAFLVRFFESEITTGTDDLKQFFFWLLAALAVPGLFIPWIMAFEWQLLARMDGAEALRIASRAEKTFYLGFTMIASGVLTAIAWSSLLPDRRDTLILGALPVQPRTVVAAKLLALAAYVGLVAVAMHAAGSIFWGSDPGRQSFPPLLAAGHRRTLRCLLRCEHVRLPCRRCRARTDALARRPATVSSGVDAASGGCRRARRVLPRLAPDDEQRHRPYAGRRPEGAAVDPFHAARVVPGRV